jgi:hypothetical protein
MSGHIRRADMTFRDDFIFPSMARTVANSAYAMIFSGGGPKTGRDGFNDRATDGFHENLKAKRQFSA